MSIRQRNELQQRWQLYRQQWASHIRIFAFLSWNWHIYWAEIDWMTYQTMATKSTILCNTWTWWISFASSQFDPIPIDLVWHISERINLASSTWEVIQWENMQFNEHYHFAAFSFFPLLSCFFPGFFLSSLTFTIIEAEKLFET